MRAVFPPSAAHIVELASLWASTRVTQHRREPCLSQDIGLLPSCSPRPSIHKGHYARAWPRVNAGNWKDGPDSHSVCVVEISQIPAQYAFGMIYHLLDELMASCSRILSLSSCLLELMSARQPSPVKAWEGAVSKDRISNPSNNEFQLQGEVFLFSSQSHTASVVGILSSPSRGFQERSFPRMGTFEGHLHSAPNCHSSNSKSFIFQIKSLLLILKPIS